MNIVFGVSTGAFILGAGAAADGGLRNLSHACSVCAAGTLGLWACYIIWRLLRD